MLSLVFLGTGCPVVAPLRAGTSLLVEAEDARLLVDCGAGVATRLVEAGARGADVDALVVTHLHTDHFVDFYQLVVSSWHQGRDRPWIVHAPAPVIAVGQALMTAWAGERAQRIAHEKRPSIVGLDVEWRELTEAPITLGELSITPFLVDHRPVEPAFGLTFAAGGARIVFSGDTAPCPALEAAAKGADLLVHEVFIDREMKPTPGVRSAETVEAVRSYHTVPREIGALAAHAGIGALALTHLVPPNADRRALIDEITAAGFGGPCIVAEDLMSFSLPDRLLAWRGMAVRY